MSDIHSLRAVRRRMHEVSSEIARLANERPEGWQRDYIDRRRAMQACVADLGTIGRRFFAASADSEALREFQQRFERFRSAIALHQARWPVVTIDPDNTDYRASMANIQSCHSALEESMDRLM